MIFSSTAPTYPSTIIKNKTTKITKHTNKKNHFGIKEKGFKIMGYKESPVEVREESLVAF